MSNLSKDLILDGYWVNKKSGTIHFVSEDFDWSGKKKLWAQSMNLRYTRDYFFKERDGSLDRFLKNYEFICDNAGIPMDFYHHVLTNKVLKDRLKYGVISKEEFFGRVFN
jgi:hypothetical protein